MWSKKVYYSSLYAECEANIGKKDEGVCKSIRIPYNTV